MNVSCHVTTIICLLANIANVQLSKTYFLSGILRLSHKMNNFKCRKCRTVLFNKNSVLTCHGKLQENTSGDDCSKSFSDVLFVSEQPQIDWIVNQIDLSEWTKGRLTCPTPKCGARLGSFNFVEDKKCICRKHFLASVQVIKSKVDEPISNCDMILQDNQIDH